MVCGCVLCVMRVTYPTLPAQRCQLDPPGKTQASHRVLTGACGALAEPRSEEKISGPGARTREHAGAERAGSSSS